MLDFHLEKSKDCEESGSQATETEHGMNKTCLITPKYEISTVLDDALSENVSLLTAPTIRHSLHA